MKYETKPLTPEEEDLIEEKINEYAYSVVPPESGTPEEEKLIFKITDNEGIVIAGCVINIHTWGRAVLGQLWVDERYRKQGLGSMLIHEAEHAVREKGCYYMCLGTTDFQARGLYEKHGYRVFTVNRDIPRGHESYSLSKRLDRPVPDYVPKNNSAAKRYKVEPGSSEDAKVIGDGLGKYCDQFVPEGHEYITLSRKLSARDGTLIAEIAAGVDGDDNAIIEGIWVEDTYRKQGLGSYLLSEIERGARENGAYVILTYACDWNVGFFLKNGYTVRGELEDYPRGHRAYELQKLL